MNYFKQVKLVVAGLALSLSSVANAGIIEQWNVDFTTASFNNVSGQGHSGYTTDNNVLTLSNDSWYSLNLNQVVGQNSLTASDTVISFDFMTTGVSEIAGIQTSNATVVNSSAAFNLIGAQGWGIVNAYNYTDINEWTHFEINLADYISGSFSKLAFINDCDGNVSGNNCGNSGVEVSFKNMSIAKVPEPTTIAILALGLIGLASRRAKK